MAYIRFNDQIDFGAGVPMFTADGQMTSNFSLITDLPQPPFERPCAMTPGPQYSSPMAPMHPMRPMQPGPLGQRGNSVAVSNIPDIKNMKELRQIFGLPDAVDREHGGIAIWSAASLKKAGYGFLHRVEIIDESVPSVAPVKHFSNIYIWVHIVPNNEQLNNILSLSKDFFYDRKKELLVVRSDCLDTAVAQASLMLLYVKGQVSFYDLVNNDLLSAYYLGIQQGRPKCKKVKKALYTILNTTKK